MDASAIVAICALAFTTVGSVVGVAVWIVGRIGGVATAVAELGATMHAHGERLERIEADATARAHTLSGVRDRLASLEGAVDAAPFVRKRGAS